MSKVISDHFMAGSLGGEITVDEVRNWWCLVVGLGEAVPPGTRLTGL